jgi:hypothetical protein
MIARFRVEGENNHINYATPRKAKTIEACLPAGRQGGHEEARRFFSVISA